MSIELNFSYSIDGFFESVNYYRSDTPMNPESMPVATATGITDLTYTDTTALVAKKYYVRFSTLRNSVEKISTEVKVFSISGSAKIWSDFTVNLDDDAGKMWTAINGASVASGALTLVRSSEQRLEMPYSSDFHFTSSEDMTIRCKVKVSTFTSDRRVLLTTRYDPSFARNWAIYLNPNGLTFLIWNGTTSGSLVNQTWDSIFTFGTEFDMSLERKDMIWRLYINGTQAGSSYSQSSNYTAYTSSKLTVGSEFNTDSTSDHSRDLDGTVRYLQIIKGQALGKGSSSTPTI